jgi:N6-adenosine-specific RNA methylase IME4
MTDCVAKYATIVADPPWHYDSWPIGRGARKGERLEIPYPTMSIYQIAALPVAQLAAKDSHLYLWTTQRYLRDAFMVVEAWGFRYSTTLIWAKPPLGIGPGGTFAPTAEFILFGRKGTLKAHTRLNRCWWDFPRTHEHSRKPEAFLDLVETVSPGPYLELFARRQRMGWETWGDQALEHVELTA